MVVGGVRGVGTVGFEELEGGKEEEYLIERGVIFLVTMMGNVREEGGTEEGKEEYGREQDVVRYLGAHTILIEDNMVDTILKGVQGRKRYFQ